MLTLLRLVESGHLELLSSDAMVYEIARIPNQYRKRQAHEMLKLVSQSIEMNDEIEMQAKGFVAAGVKPMDALHLASASWAKADYFCTCDDRLLNRSKGLEGLATQTVSPLQLVAEVIS